MPEAQANIRAPISVVEAQSKPFSLTDNTNESGNGPWRSINFAWFPAQEG
jgi:hypothetical protein